MHMHHSSLTIDGLTCVCNALRKASRSVTRFYDEKMENTGISLAQFAVLRNIGRREPLPLMDLAHILVMDRTTLYRALKPLAREGWIALDDGHGRAKTVRLTSKGHEAVANSTDAWHAAQRSLVERFGLDRWATTETALQDLVTISQEATTQ
ncbi:MarR family transcriptional regulator [Gluconacetobacter sacchari DSM 12717]|uniref:Winged helix-turn-helix transcriptional regulator n=2 Tax=Gluconacetobacter sacchari TaxID=92759 RepID=A0A7W4NNQ3_9PROT|nr:MarR family winged helix-turn-helix transcriptional regulator [Gluconacetobacter sacchari]MBB2161186.1 winged helix-turn-helix transcriptional regulator [Gluconacetobacter sacchari]GBQ20825.1 MarR family transcriptional regulator [Gluconacetobacter sacchari DSM 12717]